MRMRGTWSEMSRSTTKERRKKNGQEIQIEENFSKMKRCENGNRIEERTFWKLLSARQM
ncbi:hypothetical protein Gogos_020925 [Gossypium gossypioides]|uniref:Uncharacterized protein n=1 Tax=Gossypium gossypioides TaxID=34282 RepID=A0A7J9D2D4_GOSGO|nr:hypothetical protein [Gossypium gossypioides]